MVAKKRKKKGETIRNVFMIAFAVGMVVFFFSLDMMREGDSMFSREGKSQLFFRGHLKQKDFSSHELDRIRSYIKSYSSVLQSTTIQTSVQDPYKKMTPNSPVVFEVHLVMRDGGRLSTTTKRTTRGELVSASLVKLDKDLRAYRKLKGDGKKMDSFFNAN